MKRVSMLAVGVLVFLTTFAFRFLSFRGLPNDQYMHLAWAQQVLFGELPGRDFLEPGMPLAIGISAVAQWIARGPLSEAVLSIAMLACAATATWAVVRTLTRSTIAGIGAVLLEIGLYPRLYSYPKLLVPAVALLLMIHYLRRPSMTSIVILSAWTVVGFLLRHDLGVVTAIAVTIGLLFAHQGDRARIARTVLTYLVCGLCLVAPYLIFLHWSQGIAEHVRVGIEFGKAESHQLMVTSTPEFPAWHARSLNDWNTTDAGALLFWSTNGLIVMFLLTLIARWKHVRWEAPVVVTALVLLVGYRLYILRHSVESRVQDLAVVLAIGLAWTAVEAIRLARDHGHWSSLTVTPGPATARRATMLATALPAVLMSTLTGVLLVTMVAGTWTLRDLPAEVRQTDINHGLGASVRRAAAIIADGATPPWPRYWPSGAFPEAVGYIDACTAPDDRLLVTWSAPEYYVFTGRRFASGLALFLPPRAFVGRQDQARMVARLERQDVPLVLMNDSHAGEFRLAYPLVAAYIDRYYEPRGRFVIYDDSVIVIGVRKDLTSTRRYSPDGWPCGFERQSPPIAGRQEAVHVLER